jgi:inward rectifier potassium channel
MTLLRRKRSMREKSYEHPDIRFGHRYADVLALSEDGRVRIDYGKFHDTFEG